MQDNHCKPDQAMPKKGKVSASKLSVKYVVLNRIGAVNWVPTTHTVDVTTGLARFIYIV
ncbi:envelope-like protein, partial [Trifolium medium]|nr:envelope-like protein [Trifolium medium]